MSLTDAVDVVTGTAGNDTFRGTATEVGAADLVNGGAGTDTLIIFGAEAGVVVPELVAVEALVLVNPAATSGLNTSAISDLQSVTYRDLTTAADGKLEGLVLAGSQTLGFDNTTVDGTGGTAVGVDFGATATSASLSITNGSNVNDGIVITGAKITTVNVASNGDGSTSDNNVIDQIVTPAATTSVVFTGTQKLTVTDTMANTVKTIDASDLSGGLVVTIGNADATVTTGAGADTVAFAASEFTTLDTVNLGAGTDTLQVGDRDLAQAATADFTKAVNAAQGVEILATSASGSGGAELAINAARYTSITKFSVGAVGAITGSAGGTVNDADNGVSIFGLKGDGTESLTITSNVTGGKSGGTTSATEAADAGAGVQVRLTLDGNADVFDLIVATNNVTLTGGATGTSASAGSAGAADAGLDASEIETLNITVSKNLTIDAGSGGTGNPAEGDTIIGANGTIIISGKGDVDLGSVTATGSKNFTINASDLEGKLTVVTSSGNDTIIAGSKGSDITAGTGQDTITLGAGTDTVKMVAGDSGVTVTATSISGIDVINNFKAGLGGDVLDETGGSGSRSYDALTAGQLADIAVKGDLVAAVTAALTATTNSNWTAFEFGGKSYALWKDTDDVYETSSLDDVLVEISGVAIADLVASNFT